MKTGICFLLTRAHIFDSIINERKHAQLMVDTTIFQMEITSVVASDVCFHELPSSLTL